MRKFLSAIALVGALSVPVVGRAANFTFSASGAAGGFNGSGTLVTNSTANANGSFTITGISGTGITGLIAPGGFTFSPTTGGTLTNDNLLFPTSSSLVDSTGGFAFTDLMGNTSFRVDIFNSTSGYQAYFIDNDGFTQTLPVTFTIASVAATPEPSGLMLLGTGVLGLAGAVRRRFTRG